MTKRYVKWSEGIAVSAEDAEALMMDMAFWGTAYVESLGHGLGRRIAPEDIFVRHRDGETREAES